MWQELQVELDRQGEEIVSNLLIELGAQGVSIDDSADYVDKEDLFGEIVPLKEQSDRITICAYYPDTVEIEQIKQDLSVRLEDVKEFIAVDTVYIQQQLLEEEDWSDNWKQYYEPTRVTHDLTIVPSWTEYEPTDGEKVIRLDPGMAFGTGTHPTTKMSLFALEQVMRGGERVLDVGTGSGVLSIASSLLGAKTVYAYDLDDVAVRVANENIQLNPQTDNILVQTGHLLSGVEQEAEVIVANILADILVELVDDAYRLLKEEGYLILSGIIAEKVEMVLTATHHVGFYLETHMIQGEWNTLVLKKTQNKTGVIGG